MRTGQCGRVVESAHNVGDELAGERFDSTRRRLVIVTSMTESSVRSAPPRHGRAVHSASYCKIRTARNSSNLEVHQTGHQLDLGSGVFDLWRQWIA